MTKDFDPVISDFGQSINCNILQGHTRLNTLPLGTPGWRAPEVIQFEKTGKPYNVFKADLWSLGCILYFLLSRSLPYNEDEL